MCSYSKVSLFLTLTYYNYIFAEKSLPTTKPAISISHHYLYPPPHSKCQLLKQQPLRNPNSSSSSHQTRTSRSPKSITLIHKTLIEPRALIQRLSTITNQSCPPEVPASTGIRESSILIRYHLNATLSVNIWQASTATSTDFPCLWISKSRISEQ